MIRNLALILFGCIFLLIAFYAASPGLRVHVSPELERAAIRIIQENERKK